VFLACAGVVVSVLLSDSLIYKEKTMKDLMLLLAVTLLSLTAAAEEPKSAP
jgi:hypothetical protein